VSIAAVEMTSASYTFKKNPTIAHDFLPNLAQRVSNGDFLMEQVQMSAPRARQALCSSFLKLVLLAQTPVLSLK
jgi:hypothetical protein